MIPFILILIVYMVLLELSKNTLIGWMFTLFIAVAFLITRHNARSASQWHPKRASITWSLFLLLLAANYFLTEPPYRAVPAVDSSHPQSTGVVTVA